MNMATKSEIFSKYQREYWQATKGRKGEILDVVCEVTELTRKGAIKRFRRLQLRDPGTRERRGAPVRYGRDVDAALYEVWEAANRPCGELLHAVISEYVDTFIRDDIWNYGDEVTGKLRAMSAMTMRRRCTALREKHDVTRGISGTRPSELKQIIPIFKGPWTDCMPGEGQIDTVAHCGASLLGDFLWTVCYTDAATYWVIPRAQWNKGQAATRESVGTILERGPIRIIHLHPDTGSEFINWHLKEWCDRPEVNVHLSRSEPGKKNDNMYVEERNGHVVRKYLGYERMDCRLLVDAVNEYYEVLALYLNHFQAVRRTCSKERVGSKYKRIYEQKPRTPYQRLREHPEVADEIKGKMRAVHETLNPLLLKRQLDTLYQKIMRQVRDHGLGNCSCGRS